MQKHHRKIQVIQVLLSLVHVFLLDFLPLPIAFGGTQLPLCSALLLARQGLEDVPNLPYQGDTPAQDSALKGPSVPGLPCLRHQANPRETWA